MNTRIPRFGLLIVLGMTAAQGFMPAADATADETTGVRTLDEITIDGEVSVPQVLFISGRDQWRTLRFNHQRYLRGSREIAGSAPLPVGIWVTWSLPDDGDGQAPDELVSPVAAGSENENVSSEDE